MVREREEGERWGRRRVGGGSEIRTDTKTGLKPVTTGFPVQCSAH